jgi:hypothetical protein
MAYVNQELARLLTVPFYLKGRYAVAYDTSGKPKYPIRTRASKIVPRNNSSAACFADAETLACYYRLFIIIWASLIKTAARQSHLSRSVTRSPEAALCQTGYGAN